MPNEEYGPESWNCVDCGVNTSPGMSTRAELLIAFATSSSPVKQTITHQSEVYTVRDAVWKKAGMEPHGGCLCIGCLEGRLGRKLKRKDFPQDAAFNRPNMPSTERLMQRRG